MFPRQKHLAFVFFFPEFKLGAQLKVQKDQGIGLYAFVLFLYRSRSFVEKTSIVTNL